METGNIDRIHRVRMYPFSNANKKSHGIVSGAISFMANAYSAIQYITI